VDSFLAFTEIESLIESLICIIDPSGSMLAASATDSSSCDVLNASLSLVLTDSAKLAYETSKIVSFISTAAVLDVELVLFGF